MPILFEALPPRTDAAHEQWQDHLEALDGLAGLGIEALNVPEILDGQYRTVEPRAFAVALQARIRRPAILNCVTVHRPASELEAWVQQTRAGYGIRDFVLVGAERGTSGHPGPDPVAALRQLAPKLGAAGGRCGVVTIPGRRRGQLDEPERLRRKQDAGAAFAVSQIVADAAEATALAADLPGRGVTMPVYWSLAPVARRSDVAFLEWLGVRIPRGFEEALQGDEAARVEASHRRNLGIARELLEQAERAGTDAPSFCIEHVMQRNVEAAVELAARVRDLSRDFRVQAAPLAAW